MEFKAKSGVPVVINCAPFEDALALNNAVGNPVLGLNTDINPKFDIDNAAHGHFIVAVGSKPEVQALIMKCLARSTYNGQKIDKNTFDDPKAREDYFEIAIACLKENLTPFVHSLYSQFSGLLEAMKQKSAVTPAST